MLMVDALQIILIRLQVTICNNVFVTIDTIHWHSFANSTQQETDRLSHRESQSVSIHRYALLYMISICKLKVIDVLLLCSSH